MSIRIGQIAGASATGAWNTSDWVPIIIKSSASIGKIPVFNEDLSWLPMDVTSGAIVDALFSCSLNNPPELINLVHPQVVSGQSIFEAMKDALGRDNLTFVPYDEWLAEIEKRAAKATEQDFQKIVRFMFLRELKLGLIVSLLFTASVEGHGVHASE